jgi:hypothetical protein
MSRLAAYLTGQHRSGRIVSLLIDEAQDLLPQTLDELRLLTNLEFEGDALLPLVLVGQPELNRNLDQPAAARLKQRVSLTRATHPLVRMEVGPYIGFRLASAGCAGKALFDTAAVAAVAAYSGGIPRLINSLCDNSLLRAWNAQAAVISAEMVELAARDLRLADRVRAESRVPTAQQLEGITVGPLWTTTDDLASGTEKVFTAGGGSEPPDRTSDTIDAPHSRGIANTPFGSQVVSDAYPESAAFGPQSDSAPVETTRWLPDAPRSFRLPLSSNAWYALAGLAALSLSVLTVTKGGRIPSLPDSTAPHIVAGGIASASFDGNRSYDGSLREAVFISPSSTINAAPPRIDVVVSQGLRPLSGVETAAQSAEQQQTTPGKLQQTSLSRANIHGLTNATESPPTGDQKAAPPAGKTLRVSAASLLRKKPRANAEIISTLEPGSRVVVLSRSSDFYHVRSVENGSLRGYVHREDAFFESRKQP